VKYLIGSVSGTWNVREIQMLELQKVRKAMSPPHRNNFILKKMKNRREELYGAFFIIL